MENSNAKQIADTILAQLGGGRFIAMTGAKNLAFDKDGSLTFRIGRNAGNINAVKIELGASDLYTMKFMKIRKHNVTVAKEFDGVYNDQLQKVFTSVTGMHTSL